MNLLQILTLVLSPIYGIGLSFIFSINGIELEIEHRFYNSLIAVFFAFCTSWIYTSWREHQLNSHR